MRAQHWQQISSNKMFQFQRVQSGSQVLTSLTRLFKGRNTIIYSEGSGTQKHTFSTLGEDARNKKPFLEGSRNPNKNFPETTNSRTS